jgi:S1-C subfamily serine protease
VKPAPFLPSFHAILPWSCALLLAAPAAWGQAESPVPGNGPPPPPPSFVRVTTTSQSWNPGQPWEKNPPRTRGALAAIVGANQVVTTAEMAADATFIEFGTLDGTRHATARKVAVDYEANLALLAAEDPAAAAAFFDGTRALEVAASPQVNDLLDIVQVEDNGRPLVTRGVLQSVDVVSSFLPDQFFLTFEVKASMQSAASSYTLPVLREGKLAGILTSYDSKDQLCDVVATPILGHFLAEAADGDYTGFPSLGISTARTDDPAFRRWLKLPETEGGLYLGKIRPESAAAANGVRRGDVLLAIDGAAIDRRGYYQDPHFGPLYWSHLIRGSKRVGEKVQLSLWRDGARTEVTATLDRRAADKELVPGYQFDSPPNFLVKGGLVFQELTRPLLEAFGKEWQSSAPLNLLDVLLNPENHEAEHDRVVFLTAVIPTPATIGYERLRNLIVKRVNDKPVRDMAGLIAAFKETPEGLHSIRFDEDDLTIQLDARESDAIDAQLLERGLPSLSRLRP